MSWNLTSLRIENFKCFRNLEVKPLARVNLIVGGSNVGKTALLEAVSLLPQKHGQSPLKSLTFRDSSIESSIQTLDKWTYYDLNERAEIKIEAESGSCSISASVPAAGKMMLPKHTVGQFHLNSGKTFYWTAYDVIGGLPVMAFLSTKKQDAKQMALKYDHWTRRPENDDRFVEFLKTVDSRVKSLRPMEHTGKRMLYADVGLPERIALPMLGEGFNRLVEIIGAIIGEEADIVLIDEIENGLHWSALPQIWKGIRAAVEKEDVQIFATTHSYECIRAAAEVFKGPPLNDLAVHRLECDEDGDIRCVTMDEEALEYMLSSGWEVR